MTRLDGEHTHGHGGPAAAVSVLVAGAGAVLLADALASLVWAIAAVMVLAAAAIVAAAVRLNRRDPAAPGPVTRPHKELRGAKAIPAVERAALPAAQHIHFHGVSAAEVAEILARRSDGRQADP